MEQKGERMESITIVKCKNCAHWRPAQIIKPGGERVDYPEGLNEDYSPKKFISISDGINVGGRCVLYDWKEKNDIPHFMNAEDFCSKGIHV